MIPAVRPCSTGPSTQPFAYVGTPPVVVAPGMTASLPFEVMPGTVGVQTGCLELVSNDPRGPHEIALFTVTANRTMEVCPYTLEFGRMPRGGAATIEVRMSGHDGPQPVDGSVALVSNPADGEPTVSRTVTLRYQP